MRLRDIALQEEPGAQVRLALAVLVLCVKEGGNHGPVRL
jgi:hypothetical protein